MAPYPLCSCTYVTAFEDRQDACSLLSSIAQFPPPSCLGAVAIPYGLNTAQPFLNASHY